MSEENCPAQPEQTDRSQPLSSGFAQALIDELQADLRAWWNQLSQQQRQGNNFCAAEPEEAIDLHTLLAQFTALRHDVQLQTKVSRAATERIAELLTTGVQPAESQGSDAAVRSYLKVLIDIADNLGIALRQVEKAQQTLGEFLDEVEANPRNLSLSSARDPETVPASPQTRQDSERPRNWWRRFWRGATLPPPVLPQPSETGTSSHTPDSNRRIQQILGTIRPVIAGLADGYTLSLRRIERALSSTGLERLSCVGIPFDPETMEAIEVVAADAHTSSGIVTEEIRPGYRWRGQLFRCALVKVAR
jgi:molecular chaperone GrpE